MIFGFGKKGYTNLLTRALRDINEKWKPFLILFNWNTTFLIILVFQLIENTEEFISKLSDRFPKEKEGIKKFYGTCKRVFNCLDSMPLLSIEDPSYLFKVFFKAPLSCLGLARWLPVNAGDVARKIH